MIEVYDKSLKKVAVLQNAFDRRETQKLNAVGSFTFSLPEDDPKNEFCQPFHYVKNGGTLYRIITPGGVLGAVGEMTYTCEHVIATLIDDVLFGAHVVGNLGVYTADCINYVLSLQTEKRWVLDRCDFSRQFEYGWENENLLAALFSIPNRLDVPYMWTFDTSIFPWRLNLMEIDVNRPPQFYVRAGKNLLQRSFTRETQDVCTRLYCLGYGEGINQLTIKDVNGGVPYLQSPQEYIDKYGLISRIWVDRRFEDATSLLERGRALLKEYQEPRYSIDVDVADLADSADIYSRAELGAVARLVEDDITTYITGIERDLDRPGDMRLTLSSKPVDVAESIADLADRQRIEQVYSQGATQIYAQSVQANATPESGAVLNFWIPDEMKIVNKVLAKISLDRFRSYSKSTAGGGKSTRTSRSGGGSTQASGGGGKSTQTSGSSSRSTTSYGFDEVEDTIPTLYETDPPTQSKFDGHTHWVLVDQTTFKHSHGINHTHEVSIPSHTHSVSIPEHTHEVDLPDHTHGIEQGIFEFGSPTTARVTVEEAVVSVMDRTAEIDITDSLLNSSGKIPRGSWITLSVIPNDLAYVTIDLFIQGFIQSKGGSVY